MKFHSNGKLLITGEYAVLDGALALAVPARFGQTLEIEPREDAMIIWKSLDNKNKVWFKTEFQIKGIKNASNLSLVKSENEQKDISERLRHILMQAHLLNPLIFSESGGFTMTSRLEFPREWGLGSSSTLINNIAHFFQIDAYTLLKNTFGGSGYDIAAAQHDHPITYQLTETKRSVLTVDFKPDFMDELFFVHLNRKQNSRDSIKHYMQQPREFLEGNIEKINALTQSFVYCETLEEFKLLMTIHETLISKLINTPKIKSELFPDFPGAIKSLGGWGGDFILATGGEAEKSYFKEKGYQTMLTYAEMVK
ncbi:MAG: GYDIA family GHMP kinase [Bacteroidota bacterium]